MELIHPHLRCWNIFLNKRYHVLCNGKSPSRLVPYEKSLHVIANVIARNDCNDFRCLILSSAKCFKLIPLLWVRTDVHNF